MKVVNRTIEVDSRPMILNPDYNGFSIEQLPSEEDVELYVLKFTPMGEQLNEPLKIQWRIPAINMKGVWSPNSLHEKRIRADWENADLISCISINAPIKSFFGYKDENILTFSCSEIVQPLEISAGLREENNYMYCTLTFFTETPFPTHNYAAFIRLDKSNKHYSTCIQDAHNWCIETNNIDVPNVPEFAKKALYSTWYSYHQNLNEQSLLNECKKSNELGCELIIIDDGWQTLDNRRGYDYTGDWNADRFHNMASFVDNVHAIGMKIMLWYSVPFCGKKSEAYKKFQGKFLTENHHWAPVFDPRFPEIRDYIVSKYKNALLDWNIDGLKLDFIDDFKIYPETEVNELNGRDTLNVYEGVNKLLYQIRNELFAIKKDLLIEFRQKYIGPALHGVGNMLRAFDCPNDPVTNRIRTTDVKLIAGKIPVHSDMITWHVDEKVEIAALQLSNAIFSVPQLSLRLDTISKEHQKMIAFYVNYWNTNKDILLDGSFQAHNPLANYTKLQALKDDKLILAMYEDVKHSFNEKVNHMDVINAKLSESVCIDFTTPMHISIKSFDCQGNLILDTKEDVDGIKLFQVPPSGFLFLNKIN